VFQSLWQMGRRVMVVAVLASLACGSALAGNKKTPAAGDNGRSMTVRLVRSAEPGCEPNCPEWIVAHGEITLATPALFRGLFRKIRNRRLPVVLDSGGGSVESAISIGKMIRKHKLDVIVGNSTLSKCSASTPDCSKTHKDGEPYLGYHVIWSGTCASACPFILAGGVNRMAWGDAIGAHQIVATRSVERVKYRDTFRTQNGRKKFIRRVILSRKVFTKKPTTDLAKPYVNNLRRYFSGMGVDPSYVGFFAKATPENMYFLTSAERVATHIINADPPDTRFLTKATCSGETAASYCVKRH
jgi:hypothetical protein